MNKKTIVCHVGKEPFDVLIDRTTIFGNPFIVGKDGTRTECISKYMEWIKTQPDILNEIYKLDGKRLGCWCKPKACHGDVIVELINIHKNKSKMNLILGED